jgi:hypothetical protein
VHHAAAFPVAVADDQVAARPLLEQECEILAAGERHHPVDQVRCAGPCMRDVACERGHPRIVDEHRVAALVIDRRGRAEHGRLRMNDFLDARRQQIAHVGLQRAHRQAHLRMLGNHVRRVARVDRADRDDRHVERRHVA